MSSAHSSDIDVSVIIVNFNVRVFLAQALRSVRRSVGSLSVEIFVVDNHSVDGSCEMVRAEFPEVHLIVNKENVGFSKANNQAIAQARGRHLFILNPDTIIEESTLRTLVDFLDTHLDAGAVGCQILNPDGSFAPESRRAFPTPMVAFFRMTRLSRIFPRSRLFSRYNLGYLPRDQVAEVDALSGSCMMVRSAALKFSYTTYHDSAQADIAPEHDGAGLLDESFFMYGEDLDWCYRIQQVGWKIFYTPDTSIIHYKGESTKKNQLRYVRLFHGAMLRFAEKHFSDRYPAFILWLLHAAVVGRGFLSALVQALSHRAVRDGFLVFSVMALLGLFRSVQQNVAFPDLFYWIIAPIFALIITLTISILGGYHSRNTRLGTIAAAVSVAVLLLSAASFFIKTIAFSRMVVLASLPASILTLSIPRMMMRRTHSEAPHRTLFVGELKEALRLQASQQAMDVPLFTMIGYVPTVSPAEEEAAIPCLGSPDSLRDLVQAHEIQSVVFASASLSNKTIFVLMRRLSGLSVEMRILAQNHAHIIGKASVDFLQGVTLLEAQEALGFVRSTASRRLFDVAIALLFAVLHPWVILSTRFSGSKGFWHALGTRTRRWPELLSGRSAPVGYQNVEGFTPPQEWSLRSGIFAVTESLGNPQDDFSEDVERVYWSYVKRQSALVDWRIIMRAVRALYQRRKMLHGET